MITKLVVIDVTRQISAVTSATVLRISFSTSDIGFLGVRSPPRLFVLQDTNSLVESCQNKCPIVIFAGYDNDNDNDTLREVPHPSNEGLALQARVSGPWPHKKESVLLV